MGEVKTKPRAPPPFSTLLFSSPLVMTLLVEKDNVGSSKRQNQVGCWSGKDNVGVSKDIDGFDWLLQVIFGPFFGVLGGPDCVSRSVGRACYTDSTYPNPTLYF